MTVNAKSSVSPAAAQMGIFAGLAPLVALVFLGFLALGIPLPALSLQLHSVLGFGAVVVGWVIGAQSIVTVSSRNTAGAFSDAKGARAAVLVGLPLVALSGVAYFVAGSIVDPTLALIFILLGRVVLGLGESFFITGAMSWGISRVGPQRTGKVMSWQGIAMYAAIGLGASFGTIIYRHYGFDGVGVCTMACPLFALAIAIMLPAVKANGGRRAALHGVIKLIWRPGLVLTLATIPFASMASFMALYYEEKNWIGAGLALGGFGAGYILVRLLGSHLPDKLGGIKVAAVSLGIEAAGQIMLWSSTTQNMALAGALLTGIGFSLIFPAMGVMAMRRVPAEQRGQAVGNFSAFFDLAMGLTGPAVGLAVAQFGYAAAFSAGAVASGLALVLLLRVASAKAACAV